MKGIVRACYFRVCSLMVVVGLADWVFFNSIGKQFMLLGVFMGIMMVIYNRLIQI